MSLLMCTPDGKKVASEILKRDPSLASSRKAGNEYEDIIFTSNDYYCEVCY
jgi:hypothetical protein